MSTISLGSKVMRASPAAIEKAAQVLRSGGLVVFPTDTVYGLGGDPYNLEAIARIYRVKGRDATKPLQLLLADAAQLPLVAADSSELAQRAARRFFPGGITLVLRKAPGIPSEVVAGGTTVGVRVPDHPLCRGLIRAFGWPIAATSANRSGEPSPTTAAEAASQIGDLVDLVLDGGPCPLGRESTVLDLLGKQPRLLREGAITRKEIEGALGCLIAD